MIPITLYFRVHVEHTLGSPRVYRRAVEYPAVPRAGDRIEITDGGWSELVRDVWWQYDGGVMIEFQDHVTDTAGEKMMRLSTLAYVAEDELPHLEEAGWVVA